MRDEKEIRQRLKEIKKRFEEALENGDIESQDENGIIKNELEWVLETKTKQKEEPWNPDFSYIDDWKKEK